MVLEVYWNRAGAQRSFVVPISLGSYEAPDPRSVSGKLYARRRVFNSTARLLTSSATGLRVKFCLEAVASRAGGDHFRAPQPPRCRLSVDLYVDLVQILRLLRVDCPCSFVF